jgi:hypothetical protein
MAFDKPTRNRLASFVSEARNLIANEFTQQFQSIYGISDKGEVTALEQLGHLDDAGLSIATLLRERIEYLVRTHPGEKDGAKAAVDRLAREQAFTILNRLAALRMAEKRDLIVESVGKDYQAKGFKVFEQVAGSGLGDTYNRYRRYLFCLFDELAVDLGVLFDRSSPQGLLFPREPVLLELLKLLNAPDLDALWTEDETIGWIYQYYNDPAERKKMRDESAAPRNSRELAVRNQFFTPRYVVEFLTDNTLGRIWYEMTRGKTQLIEQCRYMVRRPKEIFLGDPAQAEDAIFGKPEERYSPNPPVAAAFQGNLTGIPEAVGWEPRWISVAIPPDQFEKITGEPYRGLYEDDRLSQVIRAACADEESPLLNDIPLFWAALSKFTLGDHSRGYSAKMWQKSWQRFVYAVKSKLAEKQSQEDLLKEPVFIPHRSLKDPREIRMLDPACGSMHFGLYAFDLFEVIYDEAWEIAHGNDTATKSSTSFAPFVSFAATYSDKAAFRADVPRLIVEYNIHGIDIDPRCAQIAGLSLWLRAHKSWQLQKVASPQRPRVRKSNIVCAEPMPGDKAMLREFVQNQFSSSEQPAFSHLLETIFDKMQLAGEAGSLLKIEEEVRSAVEEAGKLWEKRQTKPELFSTEEINRTLRPGAQQRLAGLEKAVSQVTKDFWETAEERIYTALHDYAKRAENGGGFQRRLFVEDAAHGFAFIDVCRKRYDLAVMNPPFGLLANTSKDALFKVYPTAREEMMNAMILATIARLTSRGKIGCIGNRTVFFLANHKEWRTEVLCQKAALDAFADLGHGVLDGALVETAAFVMAQGEAFERETVFLSALAERDKEAGMRAGLAEICSDQGGQRNFWLKRITDFNVIPGFRIAYSTPNSLLSLFKSTKTLDPWYGEVIVGLQTSDNGRFLRLVWEVEPKSVGRSAAELMGSTTWAFFAKGGEYSPYFSDVHLVCRWGGDGVEMKAFASDLYGHWSHNIHHPEFYFRPGLTYSRRTASSFNPRAMAAGCLFGEQGPTIFPKSPFARKPLALLGICHSRTFQAFVDLLVASGDTAVSGSAARTYERGVIGNVPIPSVTDAVLDDLSCAVETMVNLQRQLDSLDETSRFFICDRILGGETSDSITQRNLACCTAKDRIHLNALQVTASIESLVERIYGFDEETRTWIDSEYGVHPNKLCEDASLDESEFKRRFFTDEEALIDGLVQQFGGARFLTKKSYFSERKLELLSYAFGVRPEVISERRRELGLMPRSEPMESLTGLLSYIFGCAFGRWDIRYATDENAAPGLPDPFAPLPVCPPGQLQDAQGLPLSRDEVGMMRDEGRWNYPIEIPWDGILVDDPNHPLDIEARVREVIEIIWKDRAEAIEHEACEILGVKSLRDYFRKPTGFFANHLKRYSKSRRQAPVYWSLSTASGSYTLWIYYHRLNKNTLHAALADFIDPKLKSVCDEISYLRSNASQRVRLEELEDLEQELNEFRAEIERIIKLPWKPNLNDGVLITASPLWKLFRLPKWQKDLKACWEELSAGDYDWAHLAYTIWPDRVKAVCKTDSSIAIAHGLEHLCQVEAPKPKSKSKKASNVSFEDLEA